MSIISRRAFLTTATVAAVGAFVLDPERLLWVPGQRTYFDVHKTLYVASYPGCGKGFPVPFIEDELTFISLELLAAMQSVYSGRSHAK